MQRVLIVDDEPNIVIPLEFLMRKAGYEVAVARDGIEALETVDSFGPDLILLDAMMPGLDGFEVCQRIREGGNSSVKILMLTAKGRQSEITKGLGLGANAYVTKPFANAELLAAVADHLKAD